MTSYTTLQVAELSGCGIRQLDHWARTGLLEPSVRPAAGQGSRRSYSEADERLARVLGFLTTRESGGGVGGNRSIAPIRRMVSAKFRDHPSSRFYVIVDGSYVVACDTALEVVALTNKATVCIVIQPDVAGPEG